MDNPEAQTTFSFLSHKRQDEDNQSKTQSTEN